MDQLIVSKLANKNIVMYLCIACDIAHQCTSLNFNLH